MLVSKVRQTSPSSAYKGLMSTCDSNASVPRPPRGIRLLNYRLDNPDPGARRRAASALDCHAVNLGTQPGFRLGMCYAPRMDLAVVFEPIAMELLQLWLEEKRAHVC